VGARLLTAFFIVCRLAASVASLEEALAAFLLVVIGTLS